MLISHKMMVIYWWLFAVTWAALTHIQKPEPLNSASAEATMVEI